MADRWRLMVPLAVPSLGGLAYLLVFEAPTRLLAVNAAALGLALVWIVLGRLPTRPKVRLGIAAALALALVLPVLTGPDLGGVTRWYPAGPVMLQSGPLLLPLITVLAAGNARLGPIALALATGALGVQPDAASLLALAFASGTLAAMARSVPFALVAAAAAILAFVTIDVGGLEPQLYTEGVLVHVAERSVPGAIALGLLFAMPLWYLAFAAPGQRGESRALAALLIGFGTMAILAPFPFPLIGYGASPILGFGLALGAIVARYETGFRSPA